MAGTALITGGVGGLGGAVTAAFVGAGWRVVVPVLPHFMETASVILHLCSDESHAVTGTKVRVYGRA